MSQATVLILDDDPAFARAAARLAFEVGCQVQLAHSLREARAFTREHRTDLILLDLNLPDGSGLDLVEELDPARHGRIAVVTGDPSVDSAVRAMGLPIIDYLVKPFRRERLQSLLQRTMRLPGPRGDGRSGTLDTRLPGNSPGMGALRDAVLRLASSHLPVLLVGEAGTGKRQVAHALHEAGGRSDPLITADCAALAPAEQAVRLFGAEGADPGVLGRAGKGSVLLHEPACLLPQVQARLRAMVDASREAEDGAGPRLLFASRADPAALVAEGRLCEPLYYGISGLALPVPALRERGDDVVMLAELFIDQLNARHHLRRRLAPGGDRELLRHPWPGNVRELRGAVERAWLLQRSEQLRVVPALPRHAPLAVGNGMISFTIGTPLSEMEQRAVKAALDHFGNDKPAAARALGISVRTVYNHLARSEAGDEVAGDARDNAA